jgi:hypothetical protein
MPVRCEHVLERNSRHLTGSSDLLWWYHRLSYVQLTISAIEMPTVPRTQISVFSLDGGFASGNTGNFSALEIS